MISEELKKTLRTGMVVKAHLKIRETNAKGEERERTQIFEGTIIGMKHGNQPGATITVRKVSDGIGVERIIPIHSPVLANLEVVRVYKVRTKKASFLRTTKKRLKDVTKKKTV